jgi:YD repeat-containing protein
MVTTYSWDLENRLTGVVLPGGTLNTMTYDGNGKRHSYADSVELRTFFWDGENIARQINASGVTDRSYTLDPQVHGEFISQSSQFHHFDALGSTVQLTDSLQNLTDCYLYRAFGEETQLPGT